MNYSDRISAPYPPRPKDTDMSDTAKVSKMPTCNFSHDDPDTPAEYDFKTSGGSWAYGCEKHYFAHRFYKGLGTGMGQRLVLTT